MSALRAPDRFDNSTLAVDSSVNEFRSIEASLQHVLHRTTATELLRIRTKAIRSVAHDREEIMFRATYLTNFSTCSNISQRDSAKDVEQFDDIVRTFINETNKFEKKFALENNIMDKVATVPTARNRETDTCSDGYWNGGER